jgi:Acetyltransferase (GNAT) domain
VVRRDDQLVGFVTALRDGDTVVAHTIGFDRAVAAEVPIYLRLLHESVALALELGGRRLSLGRTALAPKATLGARPEPLTLWLRHRHPAVNLLARNLVRLVPHGEPPARHPFRVEPPPRRTPACRAQRDA